MVSAPDELPDQVLADYENATVYGDFEQDEVSQGKVRVLPNGWVALPTNRLLSLEAIHHIDP